MPITLLAPAKNIEVARAAIDAGADAVYIGAPRFGARASAGNSVEDIRELCRYAHVFGVEIDVTINTLLREDELKPAVDLIWQLYEAGVDAILIQDLRLLQQKLPPIRLHASTQCDNRTPEQVSALERLGFQRVVLARELSLSEMRAVRAATSCELEAFIHGALCVSYSGRCYLSEAVCGRSANRGECAQMCRLQYDVLDENKQEILHQKHILSLCDLQRSEDDLRSMIEVGISVFKIEGRLKDADYVTNVVAYYHQMLTRLGVKRASRGRVEIGFKPNPEKTFHRGATAYFLHADASQQQSPVFGRPAHLVNMHTPKSTGEYLGKAPIDTTMLHNGDGICFGNEGFYWPNSRIHIPAGTPVYRNLDVEFQRALSAKGATMRALPINVCFEETSDGFTLTAIELSVGLPVATLPVKVEKQLAGNPERAEQVLRQQLSKMGGTCYEVNRVDIAWSAPLFFPASLLNEARRQLVGLLDNADWRAFYASHALSTRDAEVVSVSESANLPASEPANLPRSKATNLSKSFCSQTESLELDESFEPQLDSFAQRSASQAAIPEALMTCRYCILYELGQCLRSSYRGPRATYLRQSNLLLRIEPHCAQCEMVLKREA